MTLRLACLLLLLLGSVALADDYGYPQLDGFASTVIGTPTELQPDLSVPGRPFRILGLDPFPDRPARNYVWYHDKLRYLLLPQKRPAPLIFLIAGTGSSYHGPSMRTVSAAFFLAGFHVVVLPSPTSLPFMVAASTTQVPGLLDDDSRDLYRVMTMAWEEQLDERLEVTGFHLAGFSLGAAQAAFISKLDEDQEVFDFGRVLMINPPVSLYSSALILDGFLRDNVASGREFMAFWDEVTEALSEEFAATRGSVQLGPDWLYRVYGKRRPDDQRLAMLIGLAFAFTAQNLVTMADVLTESAYIVPVGLKADITAYVNPYFVVSARTPFELYFRELMVPYYRRTDPAVTEDELKHRASLYSIEDYLRTTERVGVTHNADDVIMADGELDWLADVFGERATIWPRGGHGGNLAFRDNVEYMLAFFGASLPEGR
jgi:hypothetical protein